MKTKKIVIGAMAAAMLSLSVCSLAPAFAADETVQISVGSATVDAGGQFTLDVSISDIPAEGIQACQFALSFDNSVITIDSVEESSWVKGVETDPTSAVLPSFNSTTNNKKGTVDLIWATSVNEDAYLLKGEGVLCTVTGTVSKDAKAGKSEIKVVPTSRETYTGSGIINEDIDIAYNKNGEKVRYNVETVNGSVTVKGNEVVEPSTNDKYLKGDANEDGKVNVADAAAIIQHIGNQDDFGLSAQGLANADTDGDGQVMGSDALRIQLLAAGEISEL